MKNFAMLGLLLALGMFVVGCAPEKKAVKPVKAPETTTQPGDVTPPADKPEGDKPADVTPTVDKPADVAPPADKPADADKPAEEKKADVPLDTPAPK